MTNSRDKGARFERALASIFRDNGYDARRGQQYSGASGDADVIGLPYIHVEAKHYATTAFKYDWIDQAKRDASKNGRIPAVFHKTNNHEILVTMTLDDWLKLYREYESSMTLKERTTHDG